MMADDGTSGWDEGIAGLQNLIDSFPTIQRKALKAAAEAVAPRLVEAAPTRVSEKQGGNSLPEGALKASVRARVARDKSTGQLQAVVDFGELTHIAHMVDVGHNPPNTKLAKRLNKAVAGKPTPAHPFVRSVQDSCREIAETAYREAMTEGMKSAMKGNK